MKKIKSILKVIGNALLKALVFLIRMHQEAKEAEFQAALRDPVMLRRIKREAMRKYPYKSEAEINAWMEREIILNKK